MAERHIYRDVITGKDIPVPADFRGELAPGRYRRIEGKAKGDWPQPISQQQ